jgi:hypothetical protein
MVGTIRVIIQLPANRDRCGLLTVFDEYGKLLCGPFPAAARSSDHWAEMHGNAVRDPLLRFGDTPFGAYRVRSVLASGPGTMFGAASYGPHGIAMIEAMTGDAALAEANGRAHFFIVGGSLSPDGHLRSTSGNIRLTNTHQKKFLNALECSEVIRCDVVLCQEANAGAVFSDPQCYDEDPPPDPDLPYMKHAVIADKVLRHTKSDLEPRGGSRLAALNLAVSFSQRKTTNGASSDACVLMAYGGATPSAQNQDDFSVNTSDSTAHVDTPPPDTQQETPKASNTTLTYNDIDHTLTLTKPDGTAQTFPANNNVDSTSEGHWPAGTYNYVGSVTHDDDSPNSAYGSHGGVAFDVPGRTNMEIHSGREDVPDQLGRSGVNHATMGCIRTTDEGMAAIHEAIANHDQPTTITVIRSDPTTRSP